MQIVHSLEQVYCESSLARLEVSMVQAGAVVRQKTGVQDVVAGGRVAWRREVAGVRPKLGTRVLCASQDVEF